MVTFDAHFDGQHLCPDQPISLPTNVQLRVTVTERRAPEECGEGTSPPPPLPTSNKGVFGQIFERTGLVDGPPDWSAELDHYLYGTPKRADQTKS